MPLIHRSYCTNALLASITYFFLSPIINNNQVCWLASISSVVAAESHRQCTEYKVSPNDRLIGIESNQCVSSEMIAIVWFAVVDINFLDKITQPRNMRDMCSLRNFLLLFFSLTVLHVSVLIWYIIALRANGRATIVAIGQRHFQIVRGNIIIIECWRQIWIEFEIKSQVILYYVQCSGCWQ